MYSVSNFNVPTVFNSEACNEIEEAYKATKDFQDFEEGPVFKKAMELFGSEAYDTAGMMDNYHTEETILVWEAKYINLPSSSDPEDSLKELAERLQADFVNIATRSFMNRYTRGEMIQMLSLLFQGSSCEGFCGIAIGPLGMNVVDAVEIWNEMHDADGRSDNKIDWYADVYDRCTRL